MAEIENDEAPIKNICYCCIGESYLANEIKSAGYEALCAYCGRIAQSIGLDMLAERIEDAFADHYVQTANQPDPWEESLMADRELIYNWIREGLPVHEAIQEATGIDEAPAADLLEILDEKYAPYPDKDNFGEEGAFDLNSYYKRRDASFIGLHMGWQEFEHSIKTKARFFSRTAEELLARVFGGADTLKSREGRSLVVDSGPGTQLNHLYRSRVLQTDDGLMEALCRPDDCIGSPPSRMARAGRMNAQGISVFYRATTTDVAIAEVRPPVGSRVVVAKFDIIRRLRLLDLTAANDVHEEGSIFDSSFKERLHRAKFLGSLRWRMARPVMPDDEGIDYLPTQAVADFLATTNEPRLDGIIFPSVQVEEGYNVVLFHESARVAKKKIPKGMEIAAGIGNNSEDDWEIDYFVTETMPLPGASEADRQDVGHLDPIQLFNPPPDLSDDYREETLKLVTASVEVHHVTWIKIDTKAYTVRRYQRVNRPQEF